MDLIQDNNDNQNNNHSDNQNNNQDDKINIHKDDKNERVSNFNKNRTNLPILNIGGLVKSVNVLHSALNEACKKGAYDLDAAFSIKLSISNMEKCVRTISKICF